MTTDITFGNNKPVENIMHLLGTESLLFVSDGSELSLDILTELSKLAPPNIIYNLMKPNGSSSLQAKTYILVVEDVNILFKSWLVKFLNFRSKFLYISSSEVTEDTAYKTFSDLWRERRIYNAVVLSLTTGVGYTWYPYRRDSNCGKKVVLEKININEDTISPFEGKISQDYNGCNLNVIWARHPFATKNPKNKKDPG